MMYNDKNYKMFFFKENKKNNCECFFLTFIFYVQVRKNLCSPTSFEYPLPFLVNFMADIVTSLALHPLG